MSIERDLELIYEIGSLRFIQRAWRQFFGADFANLAEHHLRVAWVALLIAKHEGNVDEGKILKMALVHDVPESRTGDLHFISRQYSTRDEEKAAKDILKDTALEKELTELWVEYEKKESKEARIVKDADNLEVDFELKEQEAKGQKYPEDWISRREKGIVPRMYTETAKKLWHAIQKSNPHDWMLHAPDRFSVGDYRISEE